MSASRSSPGKRSRDTRPDWLRKRQWLLRRDKQRVKKRRCRTCGGTDHGAKLLINEHTQNSTTSDDGRTVVITLPESLDFEENYEATVSNFYNVRLAAKGKIKLKTLDFSKLRFISASASLVLASEVDRWNHRVMRRLRAKVDTWHEDIKRLLCQMGYFELLGIKRPPVPDFSKPTIFLPFIRGEVTKKDGGKLAQDMRKKIEETIGTTIKRSALFDGLTEAITNVSHHAYPKNAAFRQWWVSGSYDQTSQTLRVTFYDQGAGIPATLPYSKIFVFIFNWLNLNWDSEKIEAAMAVGRSATRRPERGQGLQNLVEFATAYDDGILTIYSLRGMYQMHARKIANETIQEVKKKDYENSIGGTLIEWSVQIPPST